MKKIVIGQQVVEWVAKKTNEHGNYGAAVGIGVEDGEIVAGVVLNQYNGASMCIHVASDGSKRWLTKELLWFVFHYAFEQARVKVLIGLIGSKNTASHRFNLHLGFVEEHRIPDAHPDGELLIHILRKENCRWLKRNHDVLQIAA